MADGVKRNKNTENGCSHPFAVDEPRSAFSVVSKGNFKPTTTRIVDDEAFQPQRKIGGVHEPEKNHTVQNMTGRSHTIHDNAVDISPDNGHNDSFRPNNGRHETGLDPTRTADFTNSNTVAFMETPIIKPIRRVNVRGDAIGPGVIFDSRDSSECREIPHPNSVHDNMNGNLRNRGGRRHEAPIFTERNENMRSSNRDSCREYSNVSNSHYPSVFSERRNNFANSHRLANDLELLSRPSWCDAKFALDQIVQGKATGNKKAVGFRSVLHRYLFRLGCLIQRRAGVALIVSLILLTACAVGLKERELETRVEKLWVESGGVLEEELEYSRKAFGDEGGALSSLLIQVGEDTASVPSLQLHLKAALAATKVTVTAYDQDWNLADICHKDVPDMGEVNGIIEHIMMGLIPCLIIGPLDCFYEGSELLGPQTPIPEFTYLGVKFPAFTWKTLDPIAMLEMISNYNILDVKKFTELIIPAGVNHGYLDRWCLDPNDPACPDMSPNFHTKKTPDVKSLFTKGCDGFAPNYMKWPNDLIVGGTEKNKTGNITRVRGLQTLFHLMGPTTMYNFHKDTVKVNNWSLQKATNIITLWQRKFVQEMYKVEINSSSFDGEPDQIHAFAPSTADDLILEFSNFSVVRVAGGYILMIVYACLTMLRCKASRSQGTVGIAGVLLVALSVMAGLGICSVLQIKFNAATTQVLPFLMLGLGVDDMFLIAHQFGEIACLNFIPFEERTGECLKRVGVSVILTSVAIISGFLFSMIIPMPALRSFAMQAAIVTCFNLFCVLVVFPAALSLDLQRRKNNRLDFFCCFQSSSANDVVELSDYGHDVSPPRRRQIPDVRFTSPPVEVHHPGMQNGTTFTMHQTIQAFSNDSYVTFLSPRPETLYAPNNVTVNVMRPDNGPSQPTPLTPPPGYTAEDHTDKVSTPEPPAAPKLAFQESPPCVPLQTTRQQTPQKQRNASRPHSSSSSTPRPSSRIHRSATSNLVTPMESVRSSTHSLVPVEKNRSWNWLCCKGKNAEYSQRMPFITLSAFAKKYYAPFLMKKQVKITVLVICCLLLGGSIYGCTIVRDGLDFIDIFPRESREHSALSAQVKYFSFYNMYLVSKEFDYAHKQKELHMLHQNMSEIKYVVRNTDGTRTKFWLERMRDWLQNLMDAFDADWSLGVINETTWNSRASADGKLAFILLSQTGKLEHPSDSGRIGCAPPFSKPCPKVNIVRLVSDDGIIREDAFYNYLTAWFQHDQLAYVASQAEIKPTPSTYDEDLKQNNFIITRSKAITYAQMPYYLNGLRENEDFVDAIKSVRSLCDHYEMQGVLTYPSGYPFLLWQQYIDLRQWLFVALGAAIFAVSAVVSLVLLNLWAGGITCFFLLMMSAEVLGFMGVVGVKLSAVPAVILISMVGLGVEFTVHITLAFITSCGSREDRTKAAISHMMGPVFDGAISTFLGVVMLSGSEFDFIIRYFFQVLAIMVLIGVWNGIVVLPVVLSMIGPKPEVEPCGGGSRLKTPTPPPTPPMEEEENVCPNCNNCSNGRFSRLYNSSYARYSSRDDVSYMQRPYTGESAQMRAPYYPSYRNPQRVHHPMDPRLQCQVNPGYSHPPSNGSSGSCTPRTAIPSDGRVYLYRPDVVLYSQRRPDRIHAQHCDSSVRGSPMEAPNSSNRVDQRIEVNEDTRGTSNHLAQPIATVTSSFTLKVLHPRHQQFPVHLTPSSNTGKSTPSNDTTKFQPILESNNARHVPSYQESMRTIPAKRATTSARISPNVDQPSEEVDSAFSELGYDNVIQ